MLIATTYFEGTFAKINTWGLYICECDNCRGCRVGIRWQRKIFI
jgi:hypothetical protein